MISYGNMGTIFHNNRDRDYLYAQMISPPGVVEFRVEDPVNAYINRVYSVGEEDQKVRYIGQSVMATNQNYILHLMKDMTSDDMAIRIYDKRSNFFSTAMFDYYIPSNSKTNFFVFPNFFFDIMFMRDEEKIYLVRMSESLLILDATNSTKVNQIISNQSNQLYVKLTARNKMGDSLHTNFHVTVVGGDNTDIYAVSNMNATKKVLYNCGDGGFSFAINGFFNGPNYELMPVDEKPDPDCNDGECYFNVTRKGMAEVFKTDFNFAKCEQIFSLPAIEDDLNIMQDDIILICIDNSNQVISTYSYNQQSKQLVPTNNITIPDSQFLGSVIDEEMRMLILFTNTTSGHDDSGQWIIHKMVVHIFTIQNSVIWKNATTIFNSSGSQYPRFDWSMEYNQVAEISYNTKFKRGALVSHPFTNPDTSITYQMLSIFDVSPQVPYIQERTSSNLTVRIDDLTNQTLTTKIIKSEVSEEGFIYALQENNKMVVYEAFDYYKLVQSQSKIVKRWEQSFPELNQWEIGGEQLVLIHDFDILDGNYIILYASDNLTLVYEIEMQIYWQYRMVLPMYQTQYQGYEYYSSSLDSNKRDLIQRRIVRSAIGQYLVLLMAQKHPQIQGQDQNEYLLFFYTFKSSQHDSLTMTQNVTNFYRNTSYQDVYLIGKSDGESGKATLMSNQRLGLYDLTLRSSLVLTQDSQLLQNLISNCSHYQHFLSIQGFMEDQGYNITNMLITAKSRFFAPDQDISFKDQFINLTVVTQNQGLIPMPVIQHDNNTARISYSGDYQNPNDDSLLMLNAIYMQNYMDGYNLSYTFNCTFTDIDGNLRHCESGILDNTQDYPATFSIEQVTSLNQIFKSFTMSRFFVMLDTSNMIHVLSLKDDRYGFEDDDLYNITQYSLNTIRSYPQQMKFGCSVANFADYFLLYNGTKEIDPGNGINDLEDFSVYLIMYQCNLNGKIVFKVSTMTVFNTTQPNPNLNRDYFMIDNSIKNLSGSIQIAVPIVQVQIYDFCKNASTFQMIIITNINGTYQNMVLFYTATLNMTARTIKFSIDENGYMSAASTKMDTFKVRQVLMVPGYGTHLALFAMEDLGVIVVDTETKQILRKYNIEQLNQFPEQVSQQQGELHIYSIAGNWPHQIHVLSNYGLYIITLKANLTDRQEIISNPNLSLKPFATRALQLYFDQYNYELASNRYGYAYLVSKNTSTQNFAVYLAGMSYFGQANSRVLRMIPITENQVCISLSIEPYLGSDYSEDEIALSFVCNTQLFVVRMSLRPFIMTNMSSFSQIQTRKMDNGVREPGYLQYGQFNLNFSAMNEYTENGIQSGQFSILLEYEPSRVSNQVMMSMAYFAIVMLLILASLSLLYLKYRQQEIGLAARSQRAILHERKSKYSVRSTKHFKTTYMQRSKEGFDLTYTSADLTTVSPLRERMILNARMDSNFESSPSSFAFSPVNFQSKKLKNYQDPFEEDKTIDKSNFQSELSLGIHHTPKNLGIRSAFKGGRKSIKDSTISNYLNGKQPIDFQKIQRENELKRNGEDAAKKNDRKALMQIIQERDRLIWEKTHIPSSSPVGSEESSKNHHRHLSAALNETKSLRESGGQYGEDLFPNSIPKNINSYGALIYTEENDCEFIMQKQTMNTKSSSREQIFGNQQKKKNNKL